MKTPENATANPAPATTIDTETWYVDVNYLGAAHYIATGVLDLPDGRLALVDPGPTSSLNGLQAGLAERDAALDDVAAVLLTHIHLDHAGATGTLAAERPDLDVYVHEIGAPHVVDPSRLLKSARRIYGDQMDVLWGEVRPVPEAQVQVVGDGDVVTLAGGRRLPVRYTPGHAVHHVSYFDEASGTAFVGDTAGQRTAGVDYVLPVTPPPDVDLEGWYESIETLRDLRPDRLFTTHFGVHGDPAWHLDQMETRLREWGDDVRASLDDDREDEARAAAFDEAKIEAMQREVAAGDRTPYENFGRPAGSWHGIARYWHKREE